MTQHTRALLAEACGTFWFFFIGAGAIITAAVSDGTLLNIALAHGITLAIAVSVFGVVSGGHFNPAVTFGLALAGRHPWMRVPTYWAAQLIGGLLAGFALRYVFDFAIAAVDKTHLGTPALAGTITPGVGILVEALLTLFLVWAVYGTAVSPLAPRIAGFGIGLTVMTDILLIVAEADDGLDYLEYHLGPRGRHMQGQPNFRMLMVAGADHTLSQADSQQHVIEAVRDHLDHTAND